MPMRGGSKTYQSSAKITGTQTTADGSLFFAENVVSVSGTTVRELHFALGPTTDTTNSLDNVTRVTVKAGSTPFIDATPAQIAAYLSYIGKKAEWEFENPGGTGPESNHLQNFVIPLHGGRGWSAPPGANLSITITKNATMGTTTAPTLQLHEGLNQVEGSQGYMSFLSSKYVIGASNNIYSINVSNPGILMGIAIPTPLNLTLLRLYDTSGLVAEFTEPRTLVYSQELYQGNQISSIGAASNPVTFWKCPIERQVVAGVTRIDVGTNSSWTDQEWGFLTYFPSPSAGK